MPEAVDSSTRWMIQLWESLYPDKVWVIPRSNTVFKRHGDELWFIEGDHDEFVSMRMHFRGIGVDVVYPR